jgi:putative PIN family toxin of toxin-antitoxin system
MIVCIDTNVMVQARAAGHPFHPILDACVSGRLKWAVSTPVLLEYEEVITRLSGGLAWRKLARLIDLIELTTGTVMRVTPHVQFLVIQEDPDDNIFTDCAITADADYLITEDRHFLVLADAGYKPQPIAPQEFMERYREICRCA